jgi:hypothetical protein
MFLLPSFYCFLVIKYEEARSHLEKSNIEKSLFSCFSDTIHFQSRLVLLLLLLFVPLRIDF